ncbi:hypothetical protein [Flammeovirga sp. SubArs3]|uniref:hypothetical protein n=1 Tax=Flammeovirga sp. SubArs3 TaxID=2995316 RepID=UPI00248CB39A|nr:hypothetical protein [Flammeovirga sp. SubArs3]
MLSSLNSIAQNKKQKETQDKNQHFRLFAEYDSFLVDLDLYLEKGVRYGTDSLIDEFSSHWQNNAINENQKEWIYKSTKRLHRNRINYRKQAAAYFNCIIAFLDSGENLKPQFTRFLEIADTCLLAYSPGVTQNFFNKTHMFVKDRKLEKSKYTTIEVQGGSFTFTHTLADEGAIADHMVIEENEEAKEEETKEDWFGSDEESVAQNDENTENTTEDSWNDSEETSSEEYDWGDDSSSSEEYDWGDDSSDSWGDDEGSYDWSEDSGSSDWGDSWSGDDSNITEYGSDNQKTDSYAEQSSMDEDCAVAEIEVTEYDPGITEMPPKDGPMLVITEADLVISTKFDTALLEKTVGTFLFKSDTLICNGGRFFWENVGFSKDSAWTELPHFCFDTRIAYIEADHAEMFFPKHLDTLAIGAFTYRSGHYNKFKEKSEYPQFISYNNIYDWKNLPENVAFKGGFALKGRHIASKAVSGSSSHLTVNGDSSKLFSISTNTSVRFNDDVDNIRTKSSDLTLYYAGGDSIVHPSVNTTLIMNDSIEYVYFRKTTDVYRFNPFILSKQNMNVHADAITWDMKQDSLDFRIVGGEKVIPLIVESPDFYQKGYFNRIQGLKKFHPLVILVNYSRNYRRKCFDSNEAIKNTNIDQELYKESLESMALEGLIEYNKYSGVVKLNDKAYRYFDRYYFAQSERRRAHLTSRMNFENLSMAQEEALVDRDFDNINIPALHPIDGTANASLTLNDSSSLTLKNVKYFPISDSLNVFAEPDSAGVTITQDRKLIFGGKFTAGTYIFRGREFIFNYDSFLIKLAEVDSINFIVTDSVTNKNVESPNPLVETGGTLFINKPFNKSGLLDISGYPSFNSKSKSNSGGRIFYDRPTVLNGAYDRRIVFELDTFTVDASQIRTDVSFKGVFNSGGIFPTFIDEVVMDPSSGIFTLERETNPSEYWSNSNGWPVYLNPRFLDVKDSIKGKGDFEGNFTLNHKGIRGNGTLHYLGSNFKSDDFIFYSDSLTTHGSGGVIESAVHPRVEMKTYDMKWFVNRDSMAFTGSHDEPFTVYNSKIKFSGELALVPNQISAIGEIETTESYNKSANIKFKKDLYISRHSKFIIHSGIEGSPSMLGNDVRVAQNISKNMVDLRTEQNSRTKSLLTFPFVKFETSINRAVWDINNKNIVMSSANSTKGKFISTKPEQDSLMIKGDSAYYDLVANKLNILEVSNIDISNIRVILDSTNQTVHIQQNAEIEPLENATIILGRYSDLDQKHQIFNAHVKLISSKQVDAHGDYLYKNNLGEEKVIKIDRVIEKEYYNENINDNTLEARAYGQVSQDDPLLFLGGMEYYGKIGLTESKRATRFKDGNVRLYIPGTETTWFGYESRNDGAKEENEDTIAHVMITKDIKSTDEGLPLMTGLFYDDKSYSFYNSFIERPEGYRQDHRRLFELEGRLTFESTNGTSSEGIYYIKPNSYYNGMEIDEIAAKYIGNFGSYNPQSQEIHFKGKMNFLPVNAKSRILSFSAGVDGVTRHGIDDVEMKASIAFGGTRPASSIAANMKSYLSSNAENVVTAIPEDYELEALGELNHQIIGMFTPDLTRGYLEGKSITNLLSEQIVILDNELRWDPEYAAFYSTGDRVKLLSVFGEYVNTEINGFVEIPKEESRDGDEEAASSDAVMNVFLEGPTGTWYYLRLENEELSILSSNKEFNNFMRKQKGVTLTTPDQASAFLERFYANYRDGQQMPVRYSDDLDKQMMPEVAEDDFGNDFEGVDSDDPESVDDDGGMDDLPAEEEDDGDDF